MHGAEEYETRFKKKERVPRKAKLTCVDLWELVLAKDDQLARCFEELGWAREDAPKHMAQLYDLLSGHVHNQFQLSALQVDIVVSVTGQGAGQAGRQAGRQSA